MASSTEAEKYQALGVIGKGSFGIIRKVRRVADQHILCRKEVSYIKMGQKERDQLYSEFSILSSLRHPNIVAYYHRQDLKDTQDLYLYMEYCSGGDLSMIIKDLAQKNQYAEESFVWSIFSQLATALYRCHYGVDPPEVGANVLGLTGKVKPPQGLRGKMILHRDLKPENVFLGEDNQVKLGDFGLSKLMQSHDFASTYVGTPYYMSPEICAAERYTLQSDIWSLGCVMYELCARKPPFDAKTHFHLVQKIKNSCVDSLPSIYSSDLQHAVKSCLNINPLQRPDTAALLSLPIIRLMRKEREVVEIGKALRLKEDQLMVKGAEVEEKNAKFDTEKEKIRVAIDDTVRREWEVKARLAIDQQIQAEMRELQKKFETEVQARVKAEVQQQHQSLNLAKPASPVSMSSDKKGEDLPTASKDVVPDLSLLSLTTKAPTKMNRSAAEPTLFHAKKPPPILSRTDIPPTGSPVHKDVLLSDPWIAIYNTLELGLYLGTYAIHSKASRHLSWLRDSYLSVTNSSLGRYKSVKTNATIKEAEPTDDVLDNIICHDVELSVLGRIFIRRRNGTIEQVKAKSLSKKVLQGVIEGDFPKLEKVTFRSS